MTPNTLQKIVLSPSGDLVALGAGRKSGKTTAITMLCEKTVKNFCVMARRAGKTQSVISMAAAGLLKTDVMIVMPNKGLVTNYAFVLNHAMEQTGKQLFFNGSSDSDRVVGIGPHTFLITTPDRAEQILKTKIYQFSDIIVDNAESFSTPSVYSLRATSLRLNCRLVLLGSVSCESGTSYDSILKQPEWVPPGAEYSLVLSPTVLGTEPSGRREVIVVGTSSTATNVEREIMVPRKIRPIIHNLSDLI